MKTTLYVALIIICLCLIGRFEIGKRVARKKTVSTAPVAPVVAPGPVVTNSGMMGLAYGLAEEQARLYNNVPIPPQGQLRGWSWEN